MQVGKRKARRVGRLQEVKRRTGEGGGKEKSFRGWDPKGPRRLGGAGRGRPFPSFPPSLPPRRRPAWPQIGSCRRRSRHGGRGLHQVYQIPALRLQLHLLGIYILIAVGAVMMFVGFLGCYGAIQESQCLLGTFFTCLVILFACEVAAGIWGFVNKDQIAKDVKQFYDQAFQQALMADSDSSNGKAVVRTFHETLDCCGPDAVVGTLTPLWRDDLCSKDFLKGLLEADASCHKKIDELFSAKLYLIGIAAIVVAVIMVSITMVGKREAGPSPMQYKPCAPQPLWYAAGLQASCPQYLVGVGAQPVGWSRTACRPF
uniref:CD81 molecule n=1 Tax=Phasianus colchicus TaxID=9054 RepID=A0A669R0P1_PHACC